MVGPGLPVRSNADHAVVRDAGRHFEPELLQVFGDDLRGAHFAVGKFRVLVKVAPPRDDFRIHGLDFGFEIGGVAE